MHAAASSLAYLLFVLSQILGNAEYPIKEPVAETIRLKNTDVFITTNAPQLPPVAFSLIQKHIYPTLGIVWN
jgi:hypothetical protein